MKRVLITLFVLVAALSVANLTLAQTEPAQTPTENACYAGGAWEGKCDWPTDAEDDWAWTCGWYYARLIDGRITSDQYPAECPGAAPGYVGCYEEPDFNAVFCFFEDGTFSVQEIVDTGVLFFPIGLVNAFGLGEADIQACLDTGNALVVPGYVIAGTTYLQFLFDDVISICYAMAFEFIP
jgi:hypothetical protein